MSIVLTNKESALFTLLLKVVESSKLDVVLRAAGGWVRDKLLGSQCSDIDIALSNMTGQEFATHLQEYAIKSGQPDLVGTVGIIKANPEQSKHLETATVKIYDLWVDFVNLRSEAYAEDSRIPKMKIGTPLEDAMRRDLTINALFYNLHTGLIEDFTERGRQDLIDHIIRTPLEPYQTLWDDPLRSLRAVRFASRFGFRIEDNLSAALKHPEILTALVSKISRERVLAELDGMLLGKNPIMSIEMIFDHSMFDKVFDAKSIQPDIDGSWAKESLAILSQVKNRSCAIPYADMDEDRRRLLLLAVCVLPLGRFQVKLSHSKSTSLADKVLRDRLKVKTKDCEVINKVLDAVNAFHKLAVENDPEMMTRLEAGLILRNCGENWVIALEIARCLSLTRDPTAFDAISAAYDKLQHQIETFDLMGVWDLKPLINGDEIRSIFRAQGPEIGIFTQKIIHLQISNPEFDKEAIIAALTTTKE